MPRSVKRTSASLSLVLVFVFGVLAQNPTSVDVMKSRISKAKALVAVKNYAAAIYELEGIKRETSEATVNMVVQVMLMSCYLEQLDYKRAQALLNEVFNAQKNGKAGTNYFVVAGQVIKGARNQQDRYKSLGLSVADRNLPAEAIADIEKMRETVEMVVTQSRTLSENKKFTADSLALLEEAGNARSGLARDEYDSTRWKNEVTDARERLTASRTTIINSVDDGNTATTDANKILAASNAPIITMSPEITVTPKPTSGSANQTVASTSPTPSSGKPSGNELPKVNVETIAKVEPPKAVPQTTVKTEPQPTPKPTSFSANQTVGIATPSPTPEKPISSDTPKVNPATVAKVDPQPAQITETQPTPKPEAAVAPPTVPEEVKTTADTDSTATIQQTVATNVATNNGGEKKAEPQTNGENPKVDTPIQVGSLIDYATSRVNPTYPPAARTLRQTGTVKVEVLVNEDGTIAELKNTSGPQILQRAATDALKKWKFKPFLRDGQPVKAMGFVSFSFNL